MHQNGNHACGRVKRLVCPHIYGQFTVNFESNVGKSRHTDHELSIVGLLVTVHEEIQWESKQKICSIVNRFFLYLFVSIFVRLYSTLLIDMQ